MSQVASHTSDPSQLAHSPCLGIISAYMPGTLRGGTMVHSFGHKVSQGSDPLTKRICPDIHHSPFGSRRKTSKHRPLRTRAMYSWASPPRTGMRCRMCRMGRMGMPWQQRCPTASLTPSLHSHRARSCLKARQLWKWRRPGISRLDAWIRHLHLAASRTCQQRASAKVGFDAVTRCLHSEHYSHQVLVSHLDV